MFFSSQQFGRKFVIIFQKKRKKRCVWCIEVGFFFLPSHRHYAPFIMGFAKAREWLCWIFFSLACRDRPKPHFPHLDKAALFDFLKGILLKFCPCVRLVIKIMMAANGIWLWKHPALRQRLKQKRIQDTHESVMRLPLWLSFWPAKNLTCIWNNIQISEYLKKKSQVLNFFFVKIALQVMFT